MSCFWWSGSVLVFTYASFPAIIANMMCVLNNASANAGVALCLRNNKPAIFFPQLFIHYLEHEQSLMISTHMYIFSTVCLNSSVQERMVWLIKEKQVVILYFNILSLLQKIKQNKRHITDMTSTVVNYMINNFPKLLRAPPWRLYDILINFHIRLLPFCSICEESDNSSCVISHITTTPSPVPCPPRITQGINVCVIKQKSAKQTNDELSKTFWGAFYVGAAMKDFCGAKNFV